mgnify:FL=1
MRDPRTEWIRVQIYRRMTPQQRLQIVCSLNQTMRELALSNIGSAHPAWSPLEVQRELRRRLLSRDLFDKVELSLSNRVAP